MRYLSLLLVLFLIAGCRESLVEEADNPIGVEFDTNRSEYNQNQRIGLSITNNSSDIILVYHACLQVDQKVNGEWEFLAYERGTCNNESSNMHVGSSMGWEGVFWEYEFPKGEYRLAMDVLLQGDWRQRERLMSRTFEIK